MAIDVTVTTQCDRCKRKEQVVISSDKVAEFEERQARDEEARKTVENFVVEHGELPDLVVIFKGKVQMLSNVCDAHCAKTVENNLETMFRVAKPRKPRTKKTPEEKAEAKAAKDAKSNGKKDKKSAAPPPPPAE
jgi:hypothetical protein